jgi:hypothetical protein
MEKKCVLCLQAFFNLIKSEENTWMFSFHLLKFEDNTWMVYFHLLKPEGKEKNIHVLSLELSKWKEKKTSMCCL